jgi:hypothetical protein
VSFRTEKRVVQTERTVEVLVCDRCPTTRTLGDKGAIHMLPADWQFFNEGERTHKVALCQDCVRTIVKIALLTDGVLR